MKIYTVFSSKEPLLIMTRESIHHTDTLAYLQRRGFTKFIAREVPAEQVRQRYGHRFEVIEDCLYQGKECRVLDYSGEQVMKFLNLSSLGPAICLESSSAPRRDPTLKACAARI